MKKVLLLFILLALNYSISNAQSLSDLPLELRKYCSSNKEHVLKNMIGETISFDLHDNSHLYIFKKLVPDTLWIREVKNKKNAKLYKHYRLDAKYSNISEINGKQFRVKKIIERIDGEIYRDFYSDVYLYNINNEKDSLKWIYHTSCNHGQIKNPEYIIKIKSASDIANTMFVNNDSLYLLTGREKSNASSYTRVKCVECNFQIYGSYLNGICERIFIDENNNQYRKTHSDNTVSVITPNEYAEIKEKNVSLLKEALEKKKQEWYNKFHLVNITLTQNKYTSKGTLKRENGEYSDNLISIRWNNTSTQIQFELKNRTDKTIEINWNQAAIVIFNTPDKVIHKGVKFNDANNSQPNSVIPSGTSLSEFVSRVSDIYYSSGWQQREIISTKAENLTAKILIPIYIQNTKIEYTFTFNIKWEYKYPKLQENH